MANFAERGVLKAPYNTLTGPIEVLTEMYVGLTAISRQNFELMTEFGNQVYSFWAGSFYPGVIGLRQLPQQKKEVSLPHVEEEFALWGEAQLDKDRTYVFKTGPLSPAQQANAKFIRHLVSKDVLNEDMGIQSNPTVASEKPNIEPGTPKVSSIIGQTVKVVEKREEELGNNGVVHKASDDLTPKQQDRGRFIQYLIKKGKMIRENEDDVNPELKKLKYELIDRYLGSVSDLEQEIRDGDMVNT